MVGVVVWWCSGWVLAVIIWACFSSCASQMSRYVLACFLQTPSDYLPSLPYVCHLVRGEGRGEEEGGGVRIVGEEGEVEGRVGEREGGNRGEEKEGKERERGGEREQDVAQID